ncbi:peptidoglycan DD-metalloendopeptidase family protein [cyanobacterium endosymbiont of Epithemia clementina EcSB]|uniref:peptidoglycan DD-metalloendopeptidase family protein n=1 Tax=cyanobacterium endosymbiont of Epithemia clementina EcSB TaxID=3034674 RepID=UPI002480500F|nr:peptidoglycan DD-metalloendopeptidase family protein [cyanobacterium endosymbiont of Epithemia clementina EcSB]WGT66701.1 peptidoglycan DD-metalloendopeptidase family protein [cyanobacterium endosymbiont of Epithemia clementina EcSB]
MKNTFTRKVTPISSCLTDYPDTSVIPIAELPLSSLTPNNNCGQVRRSTAMIGLAISMGATGLLLTHNKAAVAANSLTATATLSNLSASLSSTDATSSTKSQLAPLNLKHKVKLGESIRQLAQEYQVEAAALATLNKLSVEADLVSGQILKIPSLEESQLQAPSRQLGTVLSESQELPSKSVNTSLEHLRKTRKRLQDSLAELKTEKSNLKSDIRSLLADVSDVSQPLRPISSSSKLQENGSVRETAIRVISSQKTESVSASSLTTLVDTTGSLSSSLSSENVSSTSTPKKTSENYPLPLSSLTKLPSVPLAQMEQEEITQFNEPIPIPVSTPENDLASTAVLLPNSSTLRKSTFEPSKIEISVESSSTEQARIFPKPQVKLVQTEKSYRVQPGDTLNSIARHHGLTLSELIRANSITNPNLIKVHQSLVLPESATKAQYKNQPRKALNIPQSRNLVASSPSRFSDSPLPVSMSALSSASLAEVNKWEKQSSGNKDIEMLEISVDPSPDSYTEQLKTDIANLEQEYAVETGPGKIKIEPDTPKKSRTSVLRQTLNPEWASDRHNSPSSQQQVAQQLPKFRSQLMGAAPNDTEQYNDAFRIPVGTNVGPELPPLSVPDNYLPNTPMQFTGYIWPSKGVLTSGYGRRWGRMHRGIDIAAPIGTPIIAAAPGEVITAGWNSGGYGKLVKVRHPDGSITLYAHNNRLLVRRGQKVEQGQQIAEMGSTGYSTGPHLHFEVHPSGTGAVNPVALLPKKRK